MQSNIIFKDIMRRRVWGGVERMGRRQGKSMEEKKRSGMKFGLVLIYVSWQINP